MCGLCVTEDRVWVYWDNNDHTNIYGYGGLAGFDVRTVDEPRELKPGHELDVGCVVKPGRSL